RRTRPTTTATGRITTPETVEQAPRTAPLTPSTPSTRIERSTPSRGNSVAERNDNNSRSPFVTRGRSEQQSPSTPVTQPTTAPTRPWSDRRITQYGSTAPTSAPEQNRSPYSALNSRPAPTTMGSPSQPQNRTRSTYSTGRVEQPQARLEERDS